MYAVIAAEADAEEAAADAAGTCAAPTVFMNQADGYARWAARAQAMGQGAAWRAWSEDESCPQRNVARDTIAASEATPYCQLDDAPAACTDAYEANDSLATARTLAPGTYGELRVCTGDRDLFRSATARTVRITFRHADGDLDLFAYDASGARVGRSEGTTDSEQVSVPAGGAVEIVGYAGATNRYTLIIQ
jgi:hypothetical protein